MYNIHTIEMSARNRFPLFDSTARHRNLIDNHTRLTSDPYDSRLSKLDVYQRNSYNRTNHNRYQQQQDQQASSTISQTASQVVIYPTTNHLAYQHQHHLHHQPTTLATATVVATGHQPASLSLNHTSSSSSAAAAVAAATAATVAARYSQEQSDPYWDETGDSRKFTERRKKTVRFDGQDADDWTRWESERQGSQDSQTKDSGIDTSSTFTSSEDSTRGDGPKVYHNTEQAPKLIFFCTFSTPFIYRSSEIDDFTFDLIFNTNCFQFFIVFIFRSFLNPRLMFPL
jgi:regulating synaptic membrane exocytosis protein 2